VLTSHLPTTVPSVAAALSEPAGLAEPTARMEARMTKTERIFMFGNLGFGVGCVFVRCF